MYIYYIIIVLFSQYFLEKNFRLGSYITSLFCDEKTGFKNLFFLNTSD